MLGTRATYIFFGIVLTTFIVSLALSGTLPERMATHFDASGTANGWMSRSNYLISFGVTGFATTALVIGICWSIRYFPDSTINLPHRDRWLSPENRSRTFSTIFNWSIQFATILLLLFISLHLKIVGANQKTQPHLDFSVWVETGYLVIVMLAMIGYLYWKFARRPPA